MAAAFGVIGQALYTDYRGQHKPPEQPDLQDSQSVRLVTLLHSLP